ncbi:MAG: class II fructose-bisphosphate aldolase [Firmicutes bacterium]|nr:class II fructose-bisphosphate aldolase [Bacillota bacterium]
MHFTPMRELLSDAKRNKYAVPAFNVFNMESLQAVIETAVEEMAPVIIMAEQRDFLYVGAHYMVQMGVAAGYTASIPFALHLDHGSDLELISKAIECGFSSVMYDGSQLPFDENIRVTRQVVEMASRYGVSVEAELGHVARGTGVADQGLYTDPEMVPEFVEATGVDALAVAIGTAHGLYKCIPKLDFARLEAISKSVDIPLVLHGGSGTPDNDLKKAIQLGVCKINVGTDVRRAFMAAAVEMGQNQDLDVRDVLWVAKDRMKEIIRDRIRVFGAQGRVKTG